MVKLRELFLALLCIEVAEEKVFEMAEYVQEGEKFIRRNRTTVQFENFEGARSGRMKKTGWNGSTMEQQIRKAWEALQMRIEDYLGLFRNDVDLGPAVKYANVFEKFVPVDSQPFP